MSSFASTRGHCGLINTSFLSSSASIGVRSGLSHTLFLCSSASIWGHCAVFARRLLDDVARMQKSRCNIFVWSNVSNRFGGKDWGYFNEGEEIETDFYDWLDQISKMSNIYRLWQLPTAYVHKLSKNGPLLASFDLFLCKKIVNWIIGVEASTMTTALYPCGYIYIFRYILLCSCNMQMV